MPDSRASSSLGRKLQKWRELNAGERSQLAQLVFLLPSVWLGLRVFGFNRARRWAEFALPPTAPVSAENLQDAEQVALLASVAARNGLYQANCLHQSLALCRMLRKRGLPALIRIGVKPHTGPFQAHAWVELDNVSLGQIVDEYTAFNSLTATHQRVPTS